MLKEELGWEPPNLENILEKAEELLDTQSESDDNEVNEQDVLALFDEEEETDFEGFQDDEIELELLNDPNPLLDNNKLQSTPLLVGITSDGGNVLAGRKSGVQKRIKDKCNKNIVNVHRISHCLQLAVKDGLKEVELFLKLFTFLEQMHDFHKKSSVITAVYHNAVQTLGVRVNNIFLI